MCGHTHVHLDGGGHRINHRRLQEGENELVTQLKADSVFHTPVE